MPNTATITFSPASSRFTSSRSRSEPRQLVAAVRPCRARRSPAAAGRSRTRPGAPASRSSSTSRPGSARTASRVRGERARCVSPSSSCPRTAALRRAASSEPASSELGLVDSTSVTQRSTTSSSISSPCPRWTIADWVRLPTILWVLETTRSAPSDSACAGSVVVEGEVRAPRLVHDQRHAVGVRHLGQRRRRRPPRRSRSATPRSPRPRRASRRSARSSASGRHAVGDVQLGVELGRHERRAAGRTAPARRSCSSARCAGRPPRARGGRA